MKQYHKKDQIETFYKNNNTVENYIDSRFKTPVGKNMHINQVKIINKIIKKSSPKKVLEIACGPGRLTSEINGAFEGYAMDSSGGMLKIAKKRIKNNWEVFKGDAFNLQTNKKFDFVFTFRFIRHFKKEERKKIYSSIKKNLKPKGLLLFDAVNYNKSYKVRKRAGFHKYPVYDKLFTKKELIKELNENGFNVIRIYNVLNHLYIDTAISKLTSFLHLDSLGLNLINLLETKKSNNPLEWVVLCQKK
ncbi:MAG: class I SAM-dependent methyltransferase [Nanoarchaeota archaeon]|nr:class I SAM-dependent methyltransferase [Nanoarchaeota archaeon]